MLLGLMEKKGTNVSSHALICIIIHGAFGKKPGIQ